MVGARMSGPRESDGHVTVSCDLFHSTKQPANPQVAHKFPPIRSQIEVNPQESLDLCLQLVNIKEYVTSVYMKYPPIVKLRQQAVWYYGKESLILWQETNSITLSMFDNL